MSILFFCDFFPPAFKAGGSCRSVFNIASSLSNYYPIHVVTRSTDIDSADLPVISNSWVLNRSIHVFYASSTIQLLLILLSHLFTRKYSCFYLNSFFSPTFTILPLILAIITRTPIVLAPRGELLPPALVYSRRKKQLYLFLFQLFSRFVDKAHFSSDVERLHSLNIFPHSKHIILPDLPTYFPSDPLDNLTIVNTPSPLRLVFWGRLHPIKGLFFLIDVLSRVKRPIEFDIYGPIVDSEYWSRCLDKISSFPSNISFSYRGILHHDELTSLLSTYHLALFPSHSENFGHVIIEALGLSIPVLTSTNVPWNTTSDGCLTCLPLEVSEWQSFIELFPPAESDHFFSLKSLSRQFYLHFYKNLQAQYVDSSLFDF